MTNTITKIKAVELIEDFKLYPRSNVDGSHVSKMVYAMEAGEKFEPVLADEESKRLIDGFHRKRATIRFYGNQADIDVILKKYENEQEMFLDAMRLNARHGKGITGAEETGAILKAQELKITNDLIASSLGITQQRVDSILKTKVGYIKYARGPIGKPVALKRSVHHLKVLTKEQAEAMNGFPGQPQLLLLRQLRNMLETDCIDTSNGQIVSLLKWLRDYLAEMDI